MWAMMNKNWTEAQSYCRKNFVDLATVGSFTDQKRLNNIFFNNVSIYWIGMFLDSWQWSDQWNLFFRNWEAGKPSNSSASGDCVAMVTKDSGKWTHHSCYLQHPFICHGSEFQKAHHIYTVDVILPHFVIILFRLNFLLVFIDSHISHLLYFSS